MKNYYEILDVHRYSSEAEIRKAYFDLAKKYHPDVNSSHDSEKKFKELNEAYSILSDSLRRADYDQMADKDFVKRKMEKERDTGQKDKPQKEQSTLSLFAAALGRMTFAVASGVFVGFFTKFIVWYMSSPKPVFVIHDFYPLIIVGAVLGLFWGADLNFDVEEFLGPGYLGRAYTFLRTAVYSFSFAFIFGTLFTLMAAWANSVSLYFVGITLGLFLGGALGSQGNGVFMIKSEKGRFELLYAAARGLFIGLIGMTLGAMLGIIIGVLSGIHLTIWSGYIGFLLGAILGSMSPPNLAAYASYASSAIKSTMVLFLVAGALIVGVIFSYVLHDQIQNILTGKILGL